MKAFLKIISVLYFLSAIVMSITMWVANKREFSSDPGLGIIAVIILLIVGYFLARTHWKLSDAINSFGRKYVSILGVINIILGIIILIFWATCNEWGCLIVYPFIIVVIASLSLTLISSIIIRIKNHKVI